MPLLQSRCALHSCSAAFTAAQVSSSWHSRQRTTPPLLLPLTSETPPALLFLVSLNTVFSLRNFRDDICPAQSSLYSEGSLARQELCKCVTQTEKDLLWLLRLGFIFASFGFQMETSLCEKGSSFSCSGDTEPRTALRKPSFRHSQQTFLKKMVKTASLFHGRHRGAFLCWMKDTLGRCSTSFSPSHFKVSCLRDTPLFLLA